MEKNDIIINPSVNVKIVYSTLYDYNYLIEKGIATYCDIIIEASTGGHGVLHINDTDFYFAGAAQYKIDGNNNKVLEWEKDDTYLKKGEGSISGSTGDFSITGIYYGNAIDVSTVYTDKIVYKDDTQKGKNIQIITIEKGKGTTDKNKYYAVIKDPVILAVDDISIGGLLFSENYLDKDEIDDLYVSKDKLDKTVADISTAIEHTNTSINSIKQDITNLYNSSLYTYINENNETRINTPRENITTIKEALDIILEDLYYTEPAPINVTYTLESSDVQLAEATKNKAAYLNGKDTTMLFSWVLESNEYANSNTTITFNKVTKQYKDEQAIHITAANTTISGTLNIKTTQKDSHEKTPAPFNKTLTGEMYTEEYYVWSPDLYTTAKDIENFIKNTTDTATKTGYYKNTTEAKDVEIVLNNPNNYLYLLLYKPGNPTLSISKVNGSTTEILSSFNFKELGEISYTPYDYEIKYALYYIDKPISDVGTYKIKQNYSSGGTGGGLFWQED